MGDFLSPSVTAVFLVSTLESPFRLLHMWISRSGLMSDLIQTDHFEPEIPESVEDALELGRVNDICRQQSCSATRLSGELLKGGCK
jgi:hypothetical protein